MDNIKFNKFGVITNDKEFEYKTQTRAENRMCKCINSKIKAQIIGYKNNKPVALLWCYNPERSI